MNRSFSKATTLKYSSRTWYNYFRFYWLFLWRGERSETSSLYHMSLNLRQLNIESAMNFAHSPIPLFHLTRSASLDRLLYLYVRHNQRQISTYFVVPSNKISFTHPTTLYLHPIQLNACALALKIALEFWNSIGAGSRGLSQTWGVQLGSVTEVYASVCTRQERQYGGEL